MHDGDALRPLAGEQTSCNRRGERSLFLAVIFESTDAPVVQTESREDAIRRQSLADKSKNVIVPDSRLT